MTACRACFGSIASVWQCPRHVRLAGQLGSAGHRPERIAAAVGLGDLPRRPLPLSSQLWTYRCITVRREGSDADVSNGGEEPYWIR
jgi:hypothetical protein